MSRSTMMLLIRGKHILLGPGCGLWVIACAPADPGVTTAGGDTSGAQTTGDGVPTSGGVGPEGSSAQGSTADTTEEGSAGETTAGADIVMQDCPEGEKCTIWAADGGSVWDAYRCVPVTGDQKPDEPCTAEVSGTSGLDDCQKEAVCWDVDEQLHGVCVALCGGSVDTPVCADEDTYCEVNNEGIINICLHYCDLLLQDCPGGDLCLPIGDEPVCVIEPERTGGVLDPCEFANDCDKGLICGESASGIECDPQASGCCTPMCDLDEADVVCPGVGQSCVPLYEEGMAPPKLAHIGYCAIPE